MIQTATEKDLHLIAQCHREAFPQSITSLLGIPFITEMLKWYLSAPNKFLFWIAQDGKCVGYCGGYVMDGSDSFGSATGMSQFGFGAAAKIMLRKPWLLFHPEIRARYPFIIKNIKQKFLKKKKTSPLTEIPKTQILKPLTAGLVVIGVSPSLHKKGLGSLLQQEFEHRAKAMHAARMELSVRKENAKAIASYQRNGWCIVSDQKISYLMEKNLSS